ncbi:DNA (cytosine-5-)-methyltransferase [Amycolatopsis sp. NPDC051071]|uniref:DNA cytosine methyltransferase n=1 Tax=Amycolatopsis sp. NPDC051071 TaxID=3154637 RepID=UPI003448929C
MTERLKAIEICAGAGGQALGLHEAKFDHTLAFELDANACETLKKRQIADDVVPGDVADPDNWKLAKNYKGIDLLAGGVPCPPFTIAGKQLGADDERDLFAWTVEQVAVIKPRALLLENVRGLSMPRFAGYRQHVLDRLSSMGYFAEWRLLQASDFGVPQLRPRFVLVALKAKYAEYFHWPEPQGKVSTVGKTLKTLMGSAGWEGAAAWAKQADKIAPTIVGGSKKHGGADLGPTRAKEAWKLLGVDAMGVANEPPQSGDKFDPGPKLTCEMVARIQGFPPGTYFSGKKTAQYRQIGNAFPPPVAKAVGDSIYQALNKLGNRVPRGETEHDPVYRALKKAGDFVKAETLIKTSDGQLDVPDLERRISLLQRDFDVDVVTSNGTTLYRLGDFKAFTGQQDHSRHEVFLKNRARIS